MALGRNPNVESRNLAANGASPDGRGRSAADASSLQLPDTGIFLAGDVHPDRPLMHEAANEGSIASRGALALLDGEPVRPALRCTSLGVVFTGPDLCTGGRRIAQLDPHAIVIGTAEGRGDGRSRILHAESGLLRVYARARERPDARGHP